MLEILTIELDKIKLGDWFTTKYNPLQQAEIAELLENEVWITANKDKIPVREMTTTHINNVVNCWNGKGKKVIPDGYLGGKEKWLRIFEKELLNRS